MPFELTAKIQLLKEGNPLPVAVWLSADHTRPVWGVDSNPEVLAKGKRLIPRDSDTILVDGLILAVLVNLPGENYFETLDWFPASKNFIDLATSDLSANQTRDIYDALDASLRGVELQFTLSPTSGLMGQTASLNDLSVLAGMNHAFNTAAFEAEHVEVLPPLGHKAASEAAERVKHDLAAVALEDREEFGIYEDLPEEFEA